MKRVLFSLGVFVAMGVFVRADYINPPGWDSDLNFTHQSWSFDIGETIDILPDDGGGIRPLGFFTPDLSVEGQAAYVDGMPQIYDMGGALLLDRSGGWSFTDDQAYTTWFSMNIPNVADPGLYTELWFELTMRVPAGYETIEGITEAVEFSAYANGIIDDDNKFEYLDEEDSAYQFGTDSEGLWVRYEGILRFDPQPAYETVIFRGLLGDGQGVLVDQIDIDTHSIPEPTTICIFGLGSATLFWRRRRG